MKEKKPVLFKSNILNFFVTFLFFIFIFLLLAFASEKDIVLKKILEIDEKIEELEQMKRGYFGKAIRHENQAQRLQFIEGQLSVARRHAALAKKNMLIVDQIQMEIDALETEKSALLLKIKKE